jgi:hypothetical protein
MITEALPPTKTPPQGSGVSQVVDLDSRVSEPENRFALFLETLQASGDQRSVRPASAIE